MGICEESRPIESIWVGEDERLGAVVGMDGVTKIEAYKEPGNGAMVPWFSVWIGDRLHARYNAQYVASITYSTA